MPKVEKTTFGTPCWIDLTSTDLEAVKPFYKALFNWSFLEMGPEFGNYNIISVGEDVVGGSMQYNADFMGPDPINSWNLYFATPDVETSSTRAVELGGSLNTPAMQVGDQGTMGEVKDPSGALVGLWKPDNRKGFDRFGEHGFPGWFELLTHDYDSATRFYSELFGAELGSEPMGDDMRYATLNIDGEPSAGIWDINGVLPDDAPTQWNIYLIVNDTDATIETAKANGGKVLMEPEDSPYGRMSTLADPAGATFNIISGD